MLSSQPAVISRPLSSQSNTARIPPLWPHSAATAFVSDATRRRRATRSAEPVAISRPPLKSTIRCGN
ncbi:hypothetical protein EYF80_004924 [Liparis tanakae]|uniref:Uncharacterized protein n=1 Tax=Liparis tanakae TaxID=230148 RepID=A0A4Z2J3T2_9TELE|nr:hypothetical protein EYF80_004924 [Liparis tanakae]